MSISSDEAVFLLKSGCPVALPTETVYGLAAPLGDERATEAIFSLKGRPSSNPLIIHVCTWEQLVPLCLSPLPKEAKLLAESFWPGPLTLVLPVQQSLSLSARAGLPTAAFRMPNHPITLKIIAQVGPLVMPSANLSGRPSPTTPHHVLQDFGDNFPLVEGGICSAGVESTILAFEEGIWQILRLGALPPEVFEELLGYIPAYREESGVICPGRLFRHYAPKAKLVISESFDPSMDAIIGFSDRHYPAHCRHFILGNSGDPYSVAMNLYSILRSIDEANCHRVWVDMLFPSEGLWLTIAERLLRASSPEVDGP